MKMVSVVIPTFNRALLVSRAVSSVLFQTFHDYDVIVVDDGSTDDTRQRLRQFGDRIVLIQHPKNRGVSAARNSGIKVSSAPLIAFLDSDDYWLPKKLENQVAFFQENPKAVACQTEEVWIRNGRRVNPCNRHLKPSGHIFIPSLKRCLVSPSAVMLKRRLLEEIGFFDEDLPACEDYDLWLRILRKYPIEHIQQYHLVREGGKADQLSSTISGLDRFRIRALVKLIEKGDLRPDYLRATLQELRTKCGIYGAGCLKRGKKEEGEYYLCLPERVEKTVGFHPFIAHPTNLKGDSRKGPFQDP